MGELPYHQLLAVLARDCCAVCKLLPYQNTNSPIVIAFRCGGGSRAVELLMKTHQAFHHFQEGLAFGKWEHEPQRYLICAVESAAFLGNVGLKKSQLAACRKALFVECFQVGIQKLGEQLMIGSPALRNAEAETEVLQFQITADEARFLIACEAVFRGRLLVQDADLIRKQLNVNRKRLKTSRLVCDDLMAERAELLSNQRGFHALASIKSMEELEAYLL